MKIVSASGSARISAKGAQVLSASFDGRPLLWLSPQSGTMPPDQPVRGGVPVCFPWFGRREGLPAHGFARTRDWSVLDKAPDRVVFALVDDAATRPLWPYAFAAELAVSIDDGLRFQFSVTNRDAAPFDFTYALHTYFAVEALGAVLEDLPGTDERPLDKVFAEVPARQVIRYNERRVTIDSDMPDAVVWNPGPNDVPDIGEGWRHFLCVERGHVARPVTLGPGELHMATMTLTP